MSGEKFEKTVTIHCKCSYNMVGKEFNGKSEVWVDNVDDPVGKLFARFIGYNVMQGIAGISKLSESFFEPPKESRDEKHN